MDTADGIAECRARGKMRKAKITPLVGDKVNITVVNQNPLEGALEEILPRKNALVRPPVANIDTVVVVIATMSPSPDFFMLDKLIITAEKAGIEVVIAVNKTDLMPASQVMEAYGKAGYSVIPVCAATGEGIPALKAEIAGKVTAFAGNSGVGKSSILNYFGFDLPTGEVSKIERGKHTTRHVELMPGEEGGFVMDTPGFSLLEVQDIVSGDLKELFREFRQYNADCRFTGCNHYKTKVKDCAVVKAVEEGRISASRYESYSQLFEKLKDLKEWEI